MLRWRGFTLPELLVAVLFIAVALFGLVGVILHSVRAGETSKDRYLAGMLAQSLMARVLYQVEEDFEAAQWERPTPTPATAQFLYTATASINDTSPSSMLKQIVVEVRWEDRHGPHTYRLDTYVAPKR